MHGCEVGHVAVAYRRFVLFHPGLKYFASFSNIFDIASFARELVDCYALIYAKLYILISVDGSTNRPNEIILGGDYKR